MPRVYTVDFDIVLSAGTQNVALREFEAEKWMDEFRQAGKTSIKSWFHASEWSAFGRIGKK